MRNQISKLSRIEQINRLERKIEYFDTQADLARVSRDEQRERMFLKASTRCLQLNIRLLKSFI